MATKTAKKKVKRTGKKPAKAAKKKAAKKTTAKAKKAKTKAKKPKVEKPTKPKIEEKPEAKLKFAIREGHKEGDPITESDVVKTPPQLRVLELVQAEPLVVGVGAGLGLVVRRERGAGVRGVVDPVVAGLALGGDPELVLAVLDHGRVGHALAVLDRVALEASQIVLSSIGEQNKEERERASIGETDEVDDDGETDESDSDLNDDLHSDGDGESGED